MNHILYPRQGNLQWLIYIDWSERVPPSRPNFLHSHAVSGKCNRIADCPPPLWGLQWFEMNVKRGTFQSLYKLCTIDQFDVSKALKSMRSHLLRARKISFVQANSTPVLENGTLYKSLLCFMCTAFVRDFLFPGKNAVTTFWPLDFVLTIKNVQRDFIPWHIEITTRGRICDLLLYTKV